MMMKDITPLTSEYFISTALKVVMFHFQLKEQQ